MCLETCVKISYKSEKNEKVIAYTICVLRPYRLQSYLSELLLTRERVGGGVMV